MIGDTVHGAACFWRGMSLITKPRVRRYAFLPMLLSTLVFAGLVYAGARLYAPMVDRVHSFLPDWLAWLDWILWFLFILAALGVLGFTFVLVAGVLSSPFNGLLAEAVVTRITGGEPPASPVLTALKRLPLVIFQELKKVLYALLLAIPFLLLFLIPGVNLLAPILWFLFNAWITALSFGDYAMDNEGVPFREMRRLLWKRPGLTFGFGAMAFLALTIPVLNLFALPGAVAGAAVMWAERLRSDWRRTAGGLVTREPRRALTR